MKKFLFVLLAFGTVLGTSAAFAEGGCGEGWHRGPYGRCLRNYDGPRAYERGYDRPHERDCPRGYHLGPGGRCHSNYR